MKKFVAIAAILGMAAGAGADLIAAWDTTPLQGSNTVASASSLHANMDAGLLARGAGGTATTFNNTFAMRNANETSLANAIANDRYLSFELEASDGYHIDFDDVFFRYSMQNSATTPREISLFSSVTGFTASDAISSFQISGVNQAPAAIDLSGITELQGVTSVEFRMYMWNAPGAFDQSGLGHSFNSTGHGNDIVFSGTVSLIPEPGTIGLLGMGLLGLFAARRRFSRT